MREYNHDKGNSFQESFLPRNLDTSKLIDITPIHKSWKAFVDKDTGEIHDSEKYYDEYLSQ